MHASPDPVAPLPGTAIALSGVATLAARFDGFIVDQWGVLHDGMSPYPGALDCLERLRAAGKHVVMLSNSGRREAANVQLLQKMGFPARFFERFVAAPGVLARRYEEMGGEVFYHGKPHPAIYASCLDALRFCAPGRVIALGDSVEHDVLRAQRAGLPSALITGGIHAEALGAEAGRLPDPAVWREFEHGACARPDYLLPAFTWGAGRLS